MFNNYDNMSLFIKRSAHRWQNILNNGGGGGRVNL